MVKVKRSEVAKWENQPMSETQTDPDEATGLVSEYEAEQSVDDQPSTPSDPRDIAIRTLQICLGVVGAIAICLAAALIILLVRVGTPSQPATTDPAATSTATETTPAPLYLQNYVAVNPDKVKSGAIVVEIHDDYQCPWCARAELVYGDALAELSQSGDVDLRIHIRTLVGDQIIRNDSSERSGRAALCADRVGAFWAYHSAIFANQPEEGVGYTDDQLRNVFAGQAGITGQGLTTFQTCYDTKATEQQIAAMEQEGASAGINSTPNFYVNGLKVNFNLQTTTPISAADLLTALKNL